MIGGGSVVASIAAGAAQDPAGNASAGSTSSDNAVSLLAATDVSSSLGVARGGFRYNSSTRHYYQTITISNVSGVDLAGPFSLVLRNLTGASLVNATARTAGSDDAYVDLAPTALGAGSAITITLEFADVTGPIAYGWSVLGGGGGEVREKREDRRQKTGDRSGRCGRVRGKGLVGRGPWVGTERGAGAGARLLAVVVAWGAMGAGLGAGGGGL